jgi:hypothetical protein
MTVIDIELPCFELTILPFMNTAGSVLTDGKDDPLKDNDNGVESQVLLRKRLLWK